MTAGRSEEPREASTKPAGRPPRDRRALLDSAAAVFATSGVNAPVREIAAMAGVGIGTVYRHFPTRPELVAAVYRHQVEACAAAGPRLLAESTTPVDALRAWVSLFVQFLATKHGLAAALRGDRAGSDALHSFVERLVPVCAALLEAARDTGGRTPDVDAYSVLKGIGNLCIGADADRRYDVDAVVQMFVSGVLADGAR